MLGPAIATHLAEMRKRLDKPAEIARAADACAVACSIDAAVDDLVYEVEKDKKTGKIRATSVDLV